jgi:hypothetical protein
MANRQIVQIGVRLAICAILNRRPALFDDVGCEIRGSTQASPSNHFSEAKTLLGDKNHRREDLLLWVMFLASNNRLAVWMENRKNRKPDPGLVSSKESRYTVGHAQSRHAPHLSRESLKKSRQRLRDATRH